MIKLDEYISKDEKNKKLIFVYYKNYNMDLN